MDTPVDVIGRPSDRWIPWAIIAFFISFMVLLSGFAWIAFHTYTGEATLDAYKKGLAYNDDIANADAQKTLGWKGMLQVMPHGNTLDIAFTLNDSSGHTINDAKVIARIIRPTQAGHDVQITLPYDKDVYHGKADLNWPGVWELHISATQGQHNYQQSRTIVIQ